VVAGGEVLEEAEARGTPARVSARAESWGSKRPLLTMAEDIDTLYGERGT
jgi:hypothetical protein